MSAARRCFAIMASAMALSGCDRADMVAQPRSQNWDRSAFFADGSSMRQPVAGTQPRGEPNLPVPQPTAISQAMLDRGHERYDIFCAPCHDRSGGGRGMIVQRGFPPPPPLSNPALVRSKAAFLYDVITNGHGVMYAYGDRVPPSDRWAIVAYIRALQTSQSVDPAVLPADDRTPLEATP